MTTTAQLARPVHDLGVVPMIDEGNRATLRDAIQRYLEDKSAEDIFITVDVHECTWSDVFAELNHAKSTYEKKATKNPLRRGFRHGSGIHRNLKPLVEGIPQDNGLGLIRAGLQIVLNAVQRRTETCQTVFDTFESIPQRVLHAEFLQTAHPSNKDLHRAIEKLYYELIKCLPLLIKILLREDQSRWKKYSKSIYGDSKIEVDEILKPMIAAEERLQECQNELISQGVVDTFKLSQLSIVKHQETQNQLQLMQQEFILAQAESHGGVQKLRTEFSDRFSQLSQDMEQTKKNSLYTRRELEQNKKNSLYIFIQDGERVTAMSQADTLEVTWTSPPVSARRELIESLCDQSEREAPSHDRVSVLRKRHDFSARALARANQLFTQQRFRQWVAKLHSDMLLVNGQCGGETMGSTSAISVFCADLVEAFTEPDRHPGRVSMSQPQSPRIILEYFSGQHSVDISGLTGPQGMMRSLLDQLLRQWPDEVPLSLQRPRRLWFSRDLSIPDMCDLFETVARQLPVHFPTWCIIDNVSYFDTILGGWADELAEIVECFWRYIQGQQARGASAPVKFLLATANRSMYIWEQIPYHHQIDLGDGHLQVQSQESNIFRALLEDE